MTIQEILKLLDPKNQNLPKISASASWKTCDRINIPVFEGEEKELIKIFPCLKKHKIDGSKKEVTEVVCDGRVLWVHGMGKREKITARKLRQIFGKLYLNSLAGKPKKVGILCPEEWMAQAAQAIHVAALDPGMLKPKFKKEPVPEIVLIKPGLKGKTGEIEKGCIMAEGKNLMRMLGAIPPNILNPELYAKLIKALAKKWKVPCKQVSKKELKKYGLLNAVSRGSQYDSELLVLTLHPPKKTKEAAVVVGKGLCYDSGGLQGKQLFMKTMKEDMAGSASVLGAILTIVKNKRKLTNTTYFLLPLAESMMGEGAMHPDDIFTAGDGQTVEIMHTDAEGRLVMADAINYAKNNFKNIYRYYTIATLTGSCIIALGELYTGMVCSSSHLRKKAENAGRVCGDLVHAAPWDEEYDDNNSPVADVANLGEKDRDAGWIKAGFFLSRFVPKDKKTGELKSDFCHLDIAGSIDMKAAGRAWRRKGFSSGVGVGLLSELLTK